MKGPRCFLFSRVSASVRNMEGAASPRRILAAAMISFGCCPRPLSGPCRGKSSRSWSRGSGHGSRSYQQGPGVQRLLVLRCNDGRPGKVLVLMEPPTPFTARSAVRRGATTGIPSRNERSPRWHGEFPDGAWRPRTSQGAAFHSPRENGKGEGGVQDSH